MKFIRNFFIDILVANKQKNTSHSFIPTYGVDDNNGYCI